MEHAPETRLILACARVQLEPAQQAEIRALVEGGLDWQRVLALGRAQRLVPLLYTHLKAAAADQAPAGAMSALQEAFRYHSRRALLLAGEMQRLIRTLAQQGVPALGHKGPALAAWLYGNLALRQFDDIDLLVRPADDARAAAVLQAAGYEASLPLRPRLLRDLMQSRAELAMRHAAHRTGVELHTGLMPPVCACALDYAGVWERAVEIPFSSGLLRVPAPADTLLALAVHGAGHSWVRVQWAVDVAEIVRQQPDLDWTRLLDQASRIGARRMLCLALTVAQRLLGAPLPPEAARAIAADPAVSRLAERAEANALAERPAEGLLPDDSNFNPYYFAARERLADRLRYGWRTLVTPTYDDWSAVPLPDALVPAYVVVRTWRLAVKYGGRLLGKAE